VGFIKLFKWAFKKTKVGFFGSFFLTTTLLQGEHTMVEW